MISKVICCTSKMTIGFLGTPQKHYIHHESHRICKMTAIFLKFPSLRSKNFSVDNSHYKLFNWNKSPETYIFKNPRYHSTGDRMSTRPQKLPNDSFYGLRSSCTSSRSLKTSCVLGLSISQYFTSAACSNIQVYNIHGIFLTLEHPWSISLAQPNMRIWSLIFK